MAWELETAIGDELGIIFPSYFPSYLILEVEFVSASTSALQPNVSFPRSGSERGRICVKASLWTLAKNFIAYVARDEC